MLQTETTRAKLHKESRALLVSPRDVAGVEPCVGGLSQELLSIEVSLPSPLHLPRCVRVRVRVWCLWICICFCASTPSASAVRCATWCPYTYIYIYICYTHIHTYMHACMHVCMHAYLRTYIHITYINTCIRAHTTIAISTGVLDEQ